LDRLAAGGLALVRGAAGVAGHHAHARERHVKLLRRDLGERRDDALSELDLAGEYGDCAVGVDAQPGVEHAVPAKAARQRWRLLATRKLWTKAEGEHDAAKAGGEIAATDGHGGSSLLQRGKPQLAIPFIAPGLPRRLPCLPRLL